MTKPSQVLQAIYQADRDAGDFYVRSMLFDVASEAVIAKRDASIRTVFDGAPHALDLLRKRLGRSYIESAATGSPQFDPDAVAAYEKIAKEYEEIRKIVSGWVVVNGNRIQVYRDARGRFTSRGAAPSEARTTRETAAFYHPSTRTSGGVQGTRVLPKTFEPFLEPGVGPARYRAGGAPEEEDKLVSYGVQAREMGHTITQTMKDNNLDDRNKYKVTGSFVSTDGERDEAELRWSGGADGVWLPPANKDLGWAMEEVYVEPRNPDDTDAIDRLAAAQQKLEINIGPYAAAARSLLSDTPGARSRPESVGLGGRDRQTLLQRNVARAEKLSGALEAAGMGRSAAALRSASQVVGRVDEDADLRRALTQTAYRYRAVEAPTVGRDVQAAASTKEPSGWDAERMDYYKKRHVTGPMIAADDKFLNEAIQMGAQRDRLSLLLRNKQQARSPETAMGVLGNRQASYATLAQKIAQGVGRGIPSEGVLIDRNGVPVSQSVGIAHDTFLPFNAEALSKLKGGQYVRTRQLGGFTGEDLRTLLVGNGRAAQIVSGSGVYELELDPAVRGKKRYNDRTLQMIDTYDRILDEVAAGGHYVVPLTANMEDEANASAEKEIKAAKAKGTLTPEMEKEIRAKARADQYDKMASLNETEMGELQNLRAGIEAEARERFGSTVRFGGEALFMGGRQVGAKGRERSYASNLDYQQQMAANDWVERQMQQAVEDRENDKSRLLSLNAEGYAVALATLQQYYPYMIRTARYRSWPEMNRQAGIETRNERLPSKAGDRWYTESGGSLRPVFGGGDDAKRAYLGLPQSRAARRTAGQAARPVVAASRRPQVESVAEGGPSNITLDVQRNFQMERTRALNTVAQQGRAQQAWLEQPSDDPDINIFDAATYQALTPYNRARTFLKAMTANSNNATPVLLDRANGASIVEALSDPNTWESMPTGKMATDQHGAAKRIASSMAEQALTATARDRMKANGQNVADVDAFSIDDAVSSDADIVMGRTPAKQSALERGPEAATAKQMAAAVRMNNLDPAQATSKVMEYRELGEGLRGSSVENEPFIVQLEALQQMGVPDDDLNVIKLLQTRMEGAKQITGIEQPNILTDDDSAKKAKALVALGVGMRYSEVIGGGAGPKVPSWVRKRHQRLRKAHDPLSERDWLLLQHAYSDKEFRSLRKGLLLQ